VNVLCYERTSNHQTVGSSVWNCQVPEGDWAMGPKRRKKHPIFRIC
jgi:hypothetical protein